MSPMKSDDNAKEPFVQKFMRATNKLTKVLGPADRDHSDLTPTEAEIKADKKDQENADAHWEQHHDSNGNSYVEEKKG